jgi:NitT/TauT family transport system ATP-binding protein
MIAAAAMSVSEQPELLRVDDVTLQYKTPQHLVTATYKVAFSVHESERYVILGPSGCGKSTRLNAVGGFLAPVAGSISVRDRPVTGPGPDRLMVFQEFEQLMPWKTVLQNVMFPMRVTGKFARAEARELALATIERVKLGKFRDVYPHMLSGGMKMRVALARAMAMEPAILLMDEPFAALDAQTRTLLHEQLQELWVQTRKTILFVTHSVGEAVRLADRIIVLHSHPGRIRREIPIDLPHPRNFDSPHITELVGLVRREIEDEVNSINSKMAEGWWKPAAPADLDDDSHVLGGGI